MRKSTAFYWIDLLTPFTQKDIDGNHPCHLPLFLLPPPQIKTSTAHTLTYFSFTALFDQEKDFGTKGRTLVGGLANSSNIQCVAPIKMVAKACRNFLAKHWDLFQGYFSPHVQQLYVTNRVRHKPHHPTREEFKSRTRDHARMVKKEKRKKKKAQLQAKEGTSRF